MPRRLGTIVTSRVARRWERPGQSVVSTWLIVILILSTCVAAEGGTPRDGDIDRFVLGFDGEYSTGFAWRRTFDGTWPSIEPRRGEYDWAVMDEIVRTAAAKNQKVLWVYQTTPSWSITHEKPLEVSGWPGHARQFLPTDLRDLVRFLEAFWGRYGKSGVVGAVEIWNEPNVSGWSDVDPAKYVTLARTIYEVTKGRAPTVKVVGVSMSSGWQEWWLRQVFSRGVLEFVDVVSCHAYKELADSNPVASGPPLVGLVNGVRSLMAEYGGKKPIWITEAGVGLESRRNTDILSQAEVNKLQEARGLFPTRPWLLRNLEWRTVSEQRGAALVVRADVQSLAHGVQQLYWFKQHARDLSWFWDDLSKPTLQVRAHEVFAAFLATDPQFTRADEPLHGGGESDLYVYWFRRASDWVAILWRQRKTNVQWPMLWTGYLAPEATSIELPGDVKKIHAKSMLGEDAPVFLSGRQINLLVGEDPVYLVLTLMRR